MRKMTVTMIILMGFSATMFAPGKQIDDHCRPIAQAPVLEPAIEDLIDAIFFVEATRNPKAYNPAENAVGGLQIRQIRIDDYNRRTGRNYKLEEMYDFNKAKEVFMYYTDLYDDWETIAKRWNGSGPMTEIYWSKVKAELERKSISAP